MRFSPRVTRVIVRSTLNKANHVMSCHVLKSTENSDTLDSQEAINAIFHARMMVVSGGNVCGLATISLVELFVCLATSLPGR